MRNSPATTKVILFSGTGLAAIGAGFFLPQEWLIPAFNHSGYYFMLTLCLLWAVLIINILRDGFVTRLKKHTPALLLAAGLTVLIFGSSPN